MAKPPETIILRGPCSTFGGEYDIGVSPGEPLAMWPAKTNNDFPPPPQPPDPRAALFLPAQPVGTKGNARRLDERAFYCAFRFPEKWRSWLKLNRVTIHANGEEIECYCVDWGPNPKTGRTVDLSPGAAKALRVKTDDLVEVVLRRGL